MTGTSPSTLGDAKAAGVLRAAVEHYIASGEPVGSKTLTRSAVPYSPALIRAVMARLEATGHLSHPHTSAGRVPTDLGYRAYVDDLLMPAPLSDERRERIADLVGREASERRQRMRASARALASSTGLTGFAVSAAGPAEVHRHIELVRLRRCEVLAIYATRGGTVHHRLVTLEHDVPQAELERLQNFLNARFEDLTLTEMRALIAEELARSEEMFSSLRSRAFALSGRALPPEDGPEIDVVVGGQGNLLQLPEFSTAARAAPVLEELERRQTWMALLDATLADTGVRVLIGQENSAGGLQSCTVVAAPMQWADRVVGTIGLVGPTRLPYGEVIAIIDWVRDYLCREAA